VAINAAVSPDFAQELLDLNRLLLARLGALVGIGPGSRVFFSHSP